MAAQRLERLVNLTLALMSTRRPMTVVQIARAVPGYDLGPGGVADEAFRRMFERDKESLREQGIPVLTEPVGGWAAGEGEVGYRIPPAEYALPDISLEPDEAAALGLAARLWSSARLAEDVQTALRKLEAVGVPAREPGVAFAPRVESREPAFAPVYAALRARQAVRFGYRGPADEAARERTVEPWGVASRAGHWYLVGLDRDRGERRTFRLSRVEGDVTTVGRPGSVERPATPIDLAAQVRPPAEPELRGEALLLARRGAGWALRRDAVAATEVEGGTHLTVAYARLEVLAERVAEAAPGVVALAPEALVDSVVQRLQAVLDTHQPLPAGTR